MCVVQVAAHSSRTSNSTSALGLFILIACVNRYQLLSIAVLLSIALNKTSHSVCNVCTSEALLSTMASKEGVRIKHTGNMKTSAFSKFPRGLWFDYYMMSHLYLLVSLLLQVFSPNALTLDCDVPITSVE